MNTKRKENYNFSLVQKDLRKLPCFSIFEAQVFRNLQKDRKFESEAEKKPRKDPKEKQNR